MATKTKNRRQIHAVYGKRGDLPKAAYELNSQGDTLVPLRGTLLTRHIPVKKKRLICQKCGLPFWSVDHDRLYCLFCASWVGKEPDRRRQKTRRENIEKRKRLNR